MDCEPQHALATQYDFQRSHIDRYVRLMEDHNWRTFQPMHLFQAIDNKMLRLGLHSVTR
jgi:hypothetical protein